MSAKNFFFLFTTALIWGTAFVAQSVGMDFMGPFTFCGIRFLMGAAVLAPYVIWRRRKLKKAAAQTAHSGQMQRAGLDPHNTSDEGIFSLPWKAGILCGIFLFSASSLQQIGIMTTDVGKAGFLTAMYIVIVPVLSFFITRRSNARIWAGAVLSAAGLYFLSIDGSWEMERGDIVLIACAFLFALHIMTIDRLAEGENGVEVSCLQFLTAGVLGIIFGVVREGLAIEMTRDGFFSLAYCGVMSSGVAYTLQILGQQGADPAAASLVMSLESVIAAAAGFFLLGQVLSARELLGCALMFTAIILVQLPGKTVPGKA